MLSVPTLKFVTVHIIVILFYLFIFYINVGCVTFALDFELALSRAWTEHKVSLYTL